jgi:PAS domain S-box-containing protein
MPESLATPAEHAALEHHILHSVQAAVIATRLDGTIIYWNGFAERLYGWSSAEVLGRSIVNITVSNESADEAAQIMEVLTNGGSWTGEFGVRRKDGSVLTALVMDAPLFDEAGNQIGIVGVSHDLDVERKRTEQRVKERSNSLRLLSQRLLHSQDEERRKVARDLHDGLGQSLTLLKMTLGSMTDSEGRVKRQVVEDVRGLADQCIGEIRTLAYLLHPPLLESLGLRTAVQWLVEGFGQRSGIQVTCDVSEALPRLSAVLETALYRILQEALANIHRHSGSTVAEVEVSAEGGAVVLVVRDFGRGIPEAVLNAVNSGSSRGVGLAGIRERVAELNGTFELMSHDKGTTLKVAFPIEQHLPPGSDESHSASA